MPADAQFNATALLTVVIIEQKELEFKIKSHAAAVERSLKRTGYLLTSNPIRYYLYRFQYIKNL